MSLSRRGLISGLLAAPFVSRIPGLLMPVKSLPEEFDSDAYFEEFLSPAITRLSYAEVGIFTRKALIPKIYTQIYSTSPLFKHYLTS